MRQEIIDVLHAHYVDIKMDCTIQELADAILAVVEQRALRPGASLAEVASHIRAENDRRTRQS